MNTIKRKDVEKEIEFLKELNNKYPKSTETKIIAQELEKRGYTLELLGTGQSANIGLREIAVKNLKSKEYLNGEYLVFGYRKHRFSSKYFVRMGYVKKIVD
ncbi:hypothetical protein [Geobacillus sp. WSUCF-018B]|uniref:hypothetical protein n=1 Tax=Geobacillus sp. WSUCF-018B TaxID=2055939 RepID=UPI000C2926D4|nr:hypothetical protein [Geobacillus sp. WSUCF-018B]PJW18898.1 hypothetical protein CV944_01460 [Geobacillus sp. WSUCF-018B]